MNAPGPSWRTLAGIVLIILLVIGWSIVVVAGSVLIQGRPWPVHLTYYLVAGTIWALPLKPLLRWMLAGHRHDD